MSSFRFSADILRRLGEELNQGTDQGILELVKNAYDADARECTVALSETDQPGGSISVIDDGNGMGRRGIEDGWLVLGRSTKDRTKRSRRFKRLPAGEKGLGRLAALRLGTRAFLSTRPWGKSASSYSLLIDWDDFDGHELVDEVVLDIRTSRRKKSESHGTTILVEDLHEPISRKDIQRVARGLILLADPFGSDSSGFKPRLEAPEFEDLERLVENRYFNEAEYHLVAKVNENGRASARVLDWNGKTLFNTAHKNLAKGSGVYDCPACELNFWAFLLDRASFATRSVSMGEVQKWLGHFGGIHIYQNGIRVGPYGDSGVDWLGINARRSQSPEERPSTNNSIGRIAINDLEGELVQKTDRGGFIENDPFLEMKRFATDALEWMANERMTVAVQKRSIAKKQAQTSSTKARSNLRKTIAKAPKAIRGDLEAAEEKASAAFEKELTNLQKEIQLYRTLSTAGITSATFAHESHGNPIKNIKHSTSTVETRGKKILGRRKWEESFSKPITRIRSGLASLSVLGRATLDLLDNVKRRRGRVDVIDVFEHILDVFEPFLAGRDVEVVRSPWLKTTAFVLGTRAGVESILTNLLNNALNAMEGIPVNSKRTIRISTETLEGKMVIKVADSGRGIRDIRKKDIWLPGRTTRRDGTGLGLTIVRDATHDLGGEVSASEKSELGGAEFTIILPIRQK